MPMHGPGAEVINEMANIGVVRTSFISTQKASHRILHAFAVAVLSSSELSDMPRPTSFIGFIKRRSNVQASVKYILHCHSGIKFLI
jgi:hypothetical protein